MNIKILMGMSSYFLSTLPQFANKIAFREHQYNLSAIIDSLILFANLIIFVGKPFFGILFGNISNTSKLLLNNDEHTLYL